MEELRVLELESINGGGAFDAILVGVGILAVSWAVPVACFSPTASAGMALLGSAAVLIGCDVDVELIEY